MSNEPNEPKQPIEPNEPKQPETVKEVFSHAWKQWQEEMDKNKEVEPFSENTNKIMETLITLFGLVVFLVAMLFFFEVL